jgi:hypothetical protein
MFCADANNAKKRGQQAHALTVEDKVWLIHLAKRNPALGTIDLGERLTDRVNAGRDKELVLVNLPPHDP